MGVEKAFTLYCDNSAVVANLKELRRHKQTKHIDRKYHIISEYVEEDGLVDLCKITFEDNIADPFTKTLVARSFERYV